MSKANMIDNRTTRWTHQIARIWSAIVIAFTLLFLIGLVWNWATTGSVADPYAAEDYLPAENLPPLLILLSVLGLAIAWRWEGTGGAIAFLSGLALLPVLLVHWPITDHFPRFVAPYGLWIVVTTPGALFLLCWWQSKREAIPQNTSNRHAEPTTPSRSSENSGSSG